MGISRLVYGRSRHAGPLPQPRRLVRGAPHHGLAEHPRAARSTARSATVALGTGETLTYDRLILATGSQQPRAADRGLRRPRHRGAALGRGRDRACARSRSALPPAAPRSPAAACSASRRRTRCTRSASRRSCSSAPTGCSSRQLDARAAAILRNYLEGLGLEFVMEAEAESVDANGRLRRRHARPTAAAWRRTSCSSPRASGPTSSSPRDAGLKIHRGVLVDDRMRTDDPDDPRRRRRRRVRRASSPACGRRRWRWPRSRPTRSRAARRPTTGIVPVTILKVVGVELTSIGRFEPDRRPTTR